jgi:hypothetical protein
MSRIEIGIADAATGRDLKKDLQPMQMTVSKSIEQPAGNWSMQLNPATDWKALLSMLPVRSRLRFDMARFPEDESFGPTNMSAIVKGVSPSWNYESGTRAIGLNGGCLGRTLTDFAIYYNSALAEDPRFQKFGGDVAALVINYFAFVKEITGKETPIDISRKLITQFLDKVPAGQSLPTKIDNPEFAEELVDEVLDLFGTLKPTNLRDALTVDVDGRLAGAFGFDDDNSWIPWDQFVSDAHLNAGLLTDTSIEGSLWNAFDQYTWKPFQRMWTDTHPQSGRHEVYCHTLPFDAAPRANWDEARAKGLSDRTMPTAILYRNELIEANLQKGDDDAVNLIWVLGDVVSSGDENILIQAKSETPTIFDGTHPSSIDRLGLRKMEFHDPHLYPHGADALSTYKMFARWLGNWHQWNPLLYNGKLQIRGCNRVRPGTTILIKGWTPEPWASSDFPNFECFVQGCSWTYDWTAEGRPSLTMSCDIIRGIPVSDDVFPEEKYYSPGMMRKPRTSKDMISIVGG